jgi:hypothetical protein
MKVEDVFKTEGVPDITFIQPPGFANIIVDLRSPTRGVVFEGASGTGKTTAIQKGLEAANIPINELLILSGRKETDIHIIQEMINSVKLPASYVVVDDYHRLDESLRKGVSDLLKLAADTPGAISGKLIIAGINEVGRQLIQASEDLVKRVSINRIRTASLENALDALDAGSKELNVSIKNLETIYDESDGDYWTMQKLCQQACINAGIYETTMNLTEVKVNIPTLRASIIELLEAAFKPTLRDFARGKRFRRTNRPYITLLECFSRLGKSTALINDDLSVAFPAHKPRLDSIKKTRLPLLIESKNFGSKFYYDPITTMFSVEDPGLAYYIKKVDWSLLAKEFGFGTDDNFIYDIAVSFSGEERELVERFVSRLKEEDITVFYDKDYDSKLICSDLESEFEEIYGTQSRVICTFISKSYREREWPSFERNIWAKKVKAKSVIPIFTDFTIIKEIKDSLGRIDFYQWSAYKKEEISEEDFNEHFENLCSRVVAFLEAFES